MNSDAFRIYENKKVLVTGHTGFKGSWLTHWLLLLNAKVSGYSLDIPTSPSLFEQLGNETKIDSEINDNQTQYHLHTSKVYVAPSAFFCFLNNFLLLSSGFCAKISCLKKPSTIYPSFSNLTFSS